MRHRRDKLKLRQTSARKRPVVILPGVKQAREGYAFVQQGELLKELDYVVMFSLTIENCETVKS